MDAVSIYESQPDDKRGTPEGLLTPDHLHDARLVATSELVSSLDPISVLDVGCGYGDLADCISPAVAYTGIEQIDWIWNIARARHPKLEILKSGLDGFAQETPRRFDVVVAAGVLPTVDPADRTRFCQTLRSLAERFVVVSWLDPLHYGGRLQATSVRSLCEAFDAPVAVSPVPGDSSYLLGVVTVAR